MGNIKTLIIGGLGFIGSHLAEECLQKGHEVTIMSRSRAKIDNIKPFVDEVDLVIKDLAGVKEEVAGFDLIFNMAGSTDNYSIIEDEPYKDIDMNCTKTIALLEAIKKYNHNAKLLFASTFFVNGNPKQLPVTENSLCEPLGLYGATRLAAEHFCKIEPSPTIALVR